MSTSPMRDVEQLLLQVGVGIRRPRAPAPARVADQTSSVPIMASASTAAIRSPVHVAQRANPWPVPGCSASRCPGRARAPAGLRPAGARRRRRTGAEAAARQPLITSAPRVPGGRGDRAGRGDICGSRLGCAAAGEGGLVALQAVDRVPDLPGAGADTSAPSAGLRDHHHHHVLGVARRRERGEHRGGLARRTPRRYRSWPPPAACPAGTRANAPAAVPWVITSTSALWM